ncbi:MAG: hypothetical protein IIV02_08140, partial [Peptococcaceae bacterium]|nr:hypothetical protein [Peptococcaceae bacterium]
EKLKADYEKDLIYGFHPEGTNYNASIVHEMGHAIDFYISNNRFGSYDVITKKKMVSAEIWETDLKKSKKTSGKLSEIVSESLSGYATKNSMEYLAEGFAEAMCSSNPRPTAKSIMKRFENQIKKFSEA